MENVFHVQYLMCNLKLFFVLHKSFCLPLKLQQKSATYNCLVSVMVWTAYGCCVRAMTKKRRRPPWKLEGQWGTSDAGSGMEVEETLASQEERVWGKRVGVWLSIDLILSSLKHPLTRWTPSDEKLLYRVI